MQTDNALIFKKVKYDLMIGMIPILNRVKEMSSFYISLEYSEDKLMEEDRKKNGGRTIRMGKTF